MEVTLGILVTLLLFVLGWIIQHSLQCARFHERLARMEEWKKYIDKREREG